MPLTAEDLKAIGEMISGSTTAITAQIEQLKDDVAPTGKRFLRFEHNLASLSSYMSDKAIADRENEYYEEVERMFGAPSLVLAPVPNPPKDADPTKATEKGLVELINEALTANEVEVGRYTVEAMGQKSFRLFPETRARKTANQTCAGVIKCSKEPMVAKFGLSPFYSQPPKLRELRRVVRAFMGKFVGAKRSLKFSPNFSFSKGYVFVNDRCLFHECFVPTSDAYWADAFELMFKFLTTVRGRPDPNDPPALRAEFHDLYLRSIGLVFERDEDLEDSDES